ncbi:MAG TPA: hypothetical protein VLE72_02545 [Candidatus Saccharimonadales bacterium]|nr:hypothetical protein [Candidatus Saccharimonadales bacterium]
MSDRHQSAEDIKELKAKFVVYFRDVPVQKYAGLFIGRSENTITNWLNSDQDFCDRVNQAKAEWVKERVISAKAEFALEKLEREVFSPHPIEVKIDPLKEVLRGYGLPVDGDDNDNKTGLD